MTKTKTTKRALFTSILSLLLCVSMLVGSTFAWFTDSATTGVNKIQAGKLDVSLVDAEGNSLEGQTLKFKKATGAEGETVLWEPGCTYELPAVYVKNNGNLWLKYELLITGIDGDAKLNDAIEWTILLDGQDVKTGTLAPDTTSGALTIKGHMKKDAGNEYQGLSIDGISITVLATQMTNEHDSNDDQYDANAKYFDVDENGNVTISDVHGLLGFAAVVNAGNSFAGKTVTLAADIDLAGYQWIPIGSGTAYFSGTFNGGSHTISNMTVYAAEDAGLFGELRGKIENLTVVNATVSGNHWAGVIAGHATDNCSAAINNCTVKDSTVTLAPEIVDGKYDNGDKAGAVMGYIAAKNPGVTNCVVENVSVKAYRDLGGVVGYADAPVTGNAVKNVTLTVDKTHNYKNYTTDAQYDANPIVGEKGASATVENNTVNGTEYVEEVTAGTVEELKELIANSQASGGSVIINLDKDFNADNKWVSFDMGAYNGVNDLTINGNGHTISNLNEPLVTGTFAGNGVVTIKNLTIDSANIVHDASFAVGAFLGSSDSSGGVVIENCKLTNSTVKNNGQIYSDSLGWHGGYAGGMVGYSSSVVTVTGSTITNCIIEGASSTGAVIGQFANPATVSNVTVTNTKLHSTDDGAWRVGVIVGTANVGTVTMTGITESGNTLTQVDKTAPDHSNLYGRSLGDGITLNGSAI